jgi:hypothetical protein
VVRRLARRAQVLGTEKLCWQWIAAFAYRLNNRKMKASPSSQPFVALLFAFFAPVLYDTN